jgi:hypothetical protein
MDKEEYRRHNEERNKRSDAKSFREKWFGWWKIPSDRFAALIALFTAVLAGVAYFQLKAMRSTDDAIHHQLEIMQGQLKIAANDQRPWMGVPEITIDSNNFLNYKHVFKNVGRTPTKGLIIDGKILTPDADWGAEANTMCERWKLEFKRERRMSESGFTSIPGSGWALDLTQMPSGKTNFTFDELKKLGGFNIVECILYGSPFDDLIHQTQVIAFVSLTSISGEPRVAYVYSANAD